MEYTFNKYFEQKIEGRGQELRKIDYPIPTLEENQFLLNNLVLKKEKGPDDIRVSAPALA